MDGPSTSDERILSPKAADDATEAGDADDRADDRADAADAADDDGSGEDSGAGAASESPPADERPGWMARLRAWVARKDDGVEARWRFLDAELQRRRLLTRVFLLHLRYVFGYLAFGFLISAPLQLGMRHEEPRLMLKSLVLGGACVLPFLLLYPFTKIEWERMRVPEFKNLEVALTFWATVLALTFLLAAMVVHLVEPGAPAGGAAYDDVSWIGWLLDVRVAWLNLGLMFFSWVRVKFHVLMFRDFYTLKEEDDLVLRVPPSQLKLDLSDLRAEGERERREQARTPRPPTPRPIPPSTGPERASAPGPTSEAEPTPSLRDG